MKVVLSQQPRQELIFAEEAERGQGRLLGCLLSTETGDKLSFFEHSSETNWEKKVNKSFISNNPKKS